MQIRRLLVVGFLLAGLLGGAGLVLAQEVGQFTQVVNQVSKVKQGQGEGVPAKVPDGLANQDQVLTKEKSMAVVQFLDDSTMTVSPKSVVTIEDYMYDPGKGTAKGTIKIMQGVVESVIPATDKLQQKDIQIRTTTAIAGIRGTKLITVARPEGTIFYVLRDPSATKPRPSKIVVRSYAPEVQPDAPAVRFIAERLNKNMPVRQILEEGLEAGFDPCELIKAAVLLGITTEQLAANLQQVCIADPELKQICTPCLILKCSVEALRSLREVEITEGQYGILLKNLAPISGDIKPGDLAIIANLPNVGIDGELPNYPPTQEQVQQASLPQDVERIYNTLIQNGVDPAELADCKGALGPVYTYTPDAGVPSQDTSTVGSGISRSE
jgi:hypothetical protein